MSLRESWPHLYPQRWVWMMITTGLKAQVKAKQGMTSVWLWEWAISAKTAVTKFAGRWLRKQFLTHKRWLLDQTDSLPLGIMAVRTCYSHFASKIIRGNHWKLHHWIQLGLKATLPLISVKWVNASPYYLLQPEGLRISVMCEYFLTGRMDNCFFFFFFTKQTSFLILL